MVVIETPNRQEFVLVKDVDPSTDSLRIQVIFLTEGFKGVDL